MEKLKRKKKISTILEKANPDLAAYLGIDKAFLRDLVAEGVIRSEQSDIIENINVTSQKVDTLLKIIKETDNAYDRFVSLLGRPNSNRKDLYEYMKELQAEEGLSK